VNEIGAERSRRREKKAYSSENRNKKAAPFEPLFS